MYLTSYDLIRLQDTGPHISAIIFIIGLSLENVEEWLVVCCVENKLECLFLQTFYTLT